MTGEEIWRLVAAATAGMFLGFHYELRERPGGLRTHLITAVGGAVFAMTMMHADPGDTGRAVQGVASGVGFIGAAAVLKSQRYVRGITAAASIWVSAALGCAAGLGDSRLAVAVGAVVGVTDYVLYLLLGRRAAQSAKHGDDAWEG
ncbi:MAG: MgtC/SapB family protein [Polyangiaceae bacterium]|nr:MgtC/SapB family protein [Polyangiaceae bacterium]